MEQLNTPAKTNQPHEEKHSFFESTRNKILVAAGVVILLIAAIWIWKSVEISNLKKDNEQQQQATRQKADSAMMQANTSYLKLVAKPYVWAIRTEMMKGNIDAVNLYANDMVKEPNFKSIMVVNTKGVIVSSTDKKLEGQSYSNINDLKYITTDSTVVEKINNNDVLVASPVMGFNERIGTLLFHYAPKQINF